nr:MAG TPA: hypothetical protein [Caudoviricetes sp.]
MGFIPSRRKLCYSNFQTKQQQLSLKHLSSMPKRQTLLFSTMNIMLFKFSNQTTTTFVKTFIFNAKTADIIILDNELSNMKIHVPVSRIDADLLNKMFNTMTHKLLNDALDNNIPYVYVNLRLFVENYEKSLAAGYESIGYDRTTGCKKSVTF